MLSLALISKMSNFLHDFLIFKAAPLSRVFAFFFRNRVFFKVGFNVIDVWLMKRMCITLVP